MSHPRQAIREAARQALLNRTRAADRVSTNRAKPVPQRPMARSEEGTLPTLLVYTRSEQVALFDESPRRYRRTVELVVEAVAEEVTDLDGELDDFAQEVEVAMLRDDTLGGTLNDLRLASTATAIADEGAKLMGAAIITFEAEYFTEAPVPGTDDLDEFGSLHTRYSLEGEQEEPDQAQTILEDLDQ